MTGNVIASATMSLDGFVAYENNDPGALFDWYDAGDVEVANVSPAVKTLCPKPNL